MTVLPALAVLSLYPALITSSLGSVMLLMGSDKCPFFRPQYERWFLTHVNTSHFAFCAVVTCPVVQAVVQR
jgi:hypothetical protein